MSTTAEKPSKTAAERADEHAQEVASLLIEQLRAGTAPWQKPWEESHAGMPVNATTGKPYRGSNAVYLWATQIQNGYADDRWLTFNQAKAIGAQVRKGEHGTQICFPATHYETTREDESGKPIIGADGQPEKVYVKYDQPRMKYYTVFSAEQCYNMPPAPERAKPHEWERHERAESILRESGAEIRHGGNGAYYLPLLDRIQLPNREQFPSADRYYATALHELGHWTGHEDRLNREGVTSGAAFGTETYAKEELRAEIASLMVGQELGIGHDPGQHAAYVQSWIKVLQDDPKEILRAASDAAKIHEYVMQYDLERMITRERDNERDDGDRGRREDSLPLARVTSWEAGVMDAACIANLSNGLAIETWGAGESMGLAIRDTNSQSRIWLKDIPASEWPNVVKAMRGIEPFEVRMEALVRDGTALDKRQTVDITIGRNLDGNTMVEMKPANARGFSLQLHPEDAHRFANAMEIDTPALRRDYTTKLEHLRVENERTAEEELELAMEMNHGR